MHATNDAWRYTPERAIYQIDKLSTRQIDSLRRRLTDISHSSAPSTKIFPFSSIPHLRRVTCIVSRSATSCSLSPTQGGLTNLALFVLGKIRRASWIIDEDYRDAKGLWMKLLKCTMKVGGPPTKAFSSDPGMGRRK